jgi:threonine synthase
VGEGRIARGSLVVAVLTGNGLKDPSLALQTAPVSPEVLPADPETVKRRLLEVIG